MTDWPHAGLYGPESFTYPSGAAAVSAEWTLRTLGGEIADVYTDRDRSAAAENPGVSDVTGNISIYTDPGSYRLTVRIRNTDSVFDITVAPDPDDLGAGGGGAASVTLEPDKSDPGWQDDGAYTGDIAAQPAFTVFEGCKQPVGALHDDVTAVTGIPGLFVRWGHQFGFGIAGDLPADLGGVFGFVIDGVTVGPISVPGDDAGWAALRGEVIAAVADAFGGSYVPEDLPAGASTPFGIVFVEETADPDTGAPLYLVDFHTTFAICPTITATTGGLTGTSPTLAETATQFRAKPQVLVVGVDASNAIDPDTFAGFKGVIAQIGLSPVDNGEFSRTVFSSIPSGTEWIWLAFQGNGGPTLMGVNSPDGIAGQFQQLRCVLTQR